MSTILERKEEHGKSGADEADQRVLEYADEVHDWLLLKRYHHIVSRIITDLLIAS